MRTYVTLLALAAVLSSGVASAETQKGSRVQVKANSIWFQDLVKFDHWQRLKRAGNSAAAASYQENALSHREAWQFTKPLIVKILGYEPDKHRVHVEMKTPGRLLGSTWFLDTDALEPLSTAGVSGRNISS
jgi:hypothetical protein